MHINLTFFLQLLNIMMTIWILRKMFWPNLLTVIEAENKTLQQTALSSDEVALAIQAVTQDKNAKEALLAHTIDANFDILKKSYQPVGTLARPPQIHKLAKKCPKEKFALSSSNLISIIQQKF